MCHGHPHHHPCGHQSINWHYCPSAQIDMSRGYETPCNNSTFAASQPNNGRCFLVNCDYNPQSSGWTCCHCGNHNSGSGWCVNVTADGRWERNAMSNEWEFVNTCDHGVCHHCTQDPMSASAIEAASALRRGSKDSRGRKGRSRPANHGEASTASSEADPMAPYNISLDYSASGKKRDQKPRKH